MLLFLATYSYGQCPTFGFYGSYSADALAVTLTTTPVRTSPHIISATISGTVIISTYIGFRQLKNGLYES
jgi:hypothetical protein